MMIPSGFDVFLPTQSMKTQTLGWLIQNDLRMLRDPAKKGTGFEVADTLHLATEISKRS